MWDKTTETGSMGQVEVPLNMTGPREGDQEGVLLLIKITFELRRWKSVSQMESGRKSIPSKVNNKCKDPEAVSLGPSKCM